ncbi:MAG: elongation factor Ts [Dehalococcoidia bacterium]|nr:elongation factor Ts [Dehalococcoidia bacterium]MCA9851656.1 elongation factor Ts [Dehalococcoidia bacterium]MCA9856147.1 elongation factor Ts [Dehalococcoidia bacterium]MCB9483879.1 elongation factor Ts [Dehalococcoidia bacterium]
MVVSTDDVKRLREETGAGVMDAKRALDEAGGSFDKAREILREKGLAAAAKRADRATGQGMVEAYIHNQGRIGAMVELQCETDFVARTDGFRQLAKDIAMQVAAMNPLALNPEDVPADAAGTPEENALMTQAFIRDAGKNIQQLVQDQIAQTGENIRIARFARFELGAE